MEPACHFMVLSRSDSKMLHFEVHWGDTDWERSPLKVECYFLNV